MPAVDKKQCQASYMPAWPKHRVELDSLFGMAHQNLNLAPNWN